MGVAADSSRSGGGGRAEGSDTFLMVGVGEQEGSAPSPASDRFFDMMFTVALYTWGKRGRLRRAQAEGTCEAEMMNRSLRIARCGWVTRFARVYRVD